MKWKNGFSSQGETRPHLIGLNDLFATLSSLVGIEVPAGQAIDSLDYANYIRNETMNDNLREHFGVWTLKNGKFFEESIRKQNLKLIRNRQTETVLLYDLEADISETNNLLETNSSHFYENDINEMIAKLEEISPCYDNDETFHVTIGDDETKKVNCKWFGQQKDRCYQYREGPIYCRWSCAGYSRSTCNPFNMTMVPSESPIFITTSPSSSQSPSTTPSATPFPSSTSMPSKNDTLYPTTINTTSPTIFVTQPPSFFPSELPTTKPSFITPNSSDLPTLVSSKPSSITPNLSDLPTLVSLKPSSITIPNPSDLPTVVSSSSPSTNLCKDIPGRFQVGIRYRTCNWAKLDETYFRCKNAIIFKKCLETCNSCGLSCIDTSGLFPISLSKKKTCAGGNCSNAIVAAHCPVKCGTCP